jgi:hypothetical protein
MKTGIELIAEERKEQIEIHGYDKSHDDDHCNFELAKAAICYAQQACYRGLALWQDRTPGRWPFEAKHWKPRPQNDKTKCPIIKDSDAIKMLTIAGAFIAAEIDRLQNEPIIS